MARAGAHSMSNAAAAASARPKSQNFILPPANLSRQLAEKPQLFNGSRTRLELIPDFPKHRQLLAWPRRSGFRRPVEPSRRLDQLVDDEGEDEEGDDRRRELAIA